MSIVIWAPYMDSSLDDDGQYVWTDPCDGEYSYVLLGPEQPLPERW